MMVRRFRLLAAVAAWPAYAVARSGPGGPADNGHMDGYGHMMDYWGGGMVMWLLLAVIVAVLIYILVRASGPGAVGRTPTETPLDILQKRYARGEITKEQFDEIKKDL